MTDRRLLDTNTVSDLARNPAGPAVSRLAQAGDDAVCTSVIVAAELRFGTAKRGSDRLTRQLEQVLAAIEILPLSPRADHLYGEIRTRLELAGAPMGGNDMLIASHALALDCILVTDNEREFSRAPGLRVENWLR